MAKVNASAVVTYLVPPATLERIGSDSTTTMLISSTQSCGGCCSTVAGPLPSTSRTTSASPTAETVST
jgi:hypothetical protein